MPYQPLSHEIYWKVQKRYRKHFQQVLGKGESPWSLWSDFSSKLSTKEEAENFPKVYPLGTEEEIRIVRVTHVEEVMEK